MTIQHAHAEKNVNDMQGDIVPTPFSHTSEKNREEKSVRRVSCGLDRAMRKNGRKLSHFRTTICDKEQFNGTKQVEIVAHMMAGVGNVLSRVRWCGHGHTVVMDTMKRPKSTKNAPRALADAAKAREHRGKMHQLDERVGLDVWE